MIGCWIIAISLIVALFLDVAYFWTYKEIYFKISATAFIVCLIALICTMLYYDTTDKTAEAVPCECGCSCCE